MLKTTLRSKKGAAIEWAIVFGFVMFALLLLITTILFSITMNIKLSHNITDKARDLNQIGEYFLRSVESGTPFDNGAADSDQETASFLSSCKSKNNYTFVCKYGKNTAKAEYYRILTVKDANANPVMTFIVAESAAGTTPANPVTKFKTLYKGINGNAYSDAELNSAISSLGITEITNEIAFLQERNDWYNVKVGNVSTFNISFDLDGGSGSFPVIEAEKGKCTLPASVPTRSGKVFGGWTDNNGISVYLAGASYTTSADVTLKALWRNACTVTLKTSSSTYGTVSPTSLSNVPEGSVVYKGGNTLTINGKTVTATAKSGYAFSDWDVADGYTLTGNKTITANFVQCYKVTVSCATGGSVNVTSVSNVPKNSHVSVSGNSITVNGTTVTATANSGYRFTGWDVADGYTITGNKTIKANFIKLYKLTVSTDTAKGSLSSTAIENIPSGSTVSVVGATLTVDGRSITATPKSGYVFGSWSISNGTSITGDKSVTVNWVQLVTVNISSNNTSMGTVDTASISGVRSDATISVRSNTITINGTTVTATALDGYEFDGWNVSNGTTVSGHTSIVATFDKKDSGCFASGTLITMADGSYKKIEDVRAGDVVKTWNFEDGDYRDMPVTYVWDYGENTYTVMNLEFSNGTVLKLITQHELFVADSHTFEEIDENNYESFIGKKFAYSNGSGFEDTVLANVYLTEETTGMYSLMTAVSINSFADGILSQPTTDIPDFFKYFEISADMKYDAEKMQNDIDNYGISEYKDWEFLGSYQNFVAFNGKYFDVLIGKGIATKQDIIDYALKYTK